MSWAPNFFTVGPFASASVHQQNFADGLYFAHLFHDSLQERQKIEAAHARAIAEENLELALAKQTELDYLDGIFKLTLEIHSPADGSDS